ncbi:MAG: hypothetical protein U5K84_07120 [Alkalibacterium sp.]|nr:hypothetical protein [Alkalibacterium sp.]
MVESTGGMTIVTIYAYSEEEVRETSSNVPETYFREDFFDTELSSQAEDFEVILQLPIEEGHSWESPSGSTSEITSVDVEKETPEWSLFQRSKSPVRIATTARSI